MWIADGLMAVFYPMLKFYKHLPRQSIWAGYLLHNFYLYRLSPFGPLKMIKVWVVTGKRATDSTLNEQFKFEKRKTI